MIHQLLLRSLILLHLKICRYDRAIKYFLRATRRIDAEIVVKRRGTGNVEANRRQLERLSDWKRRQVIEFQKRHVIIL